ncbi:hypothetical protein RRG08_065191 [Elysia crispata]|uniref:Uncharacterized protein n=1 Tax=Elysia crispata TaxID=231223 RepID=A0AAE0ZY79_9GAST|nr:hypothetical protein RRG08_065191 [Elysia crispata]
MCLSHAPPRADRAASAAGNGSIHHQFGEIALLCLQPCWFLSIFSVSYLITVRAPFTMMDLSMHAVQQTCRTVSDDDGSDAHGRSVLECRVGLSTILVSANGV